MNKYLSVITNFGCHYKCPECIVRENGLKIPKTTIEGLNNLTKEIKRGDYNWVSISGGGDPLFEIENHLDWYDKFFLYFNVARICNFLTIKSELHTSYLPINNEIRTVPSCFDRFIYKFDRIVYHVHDINDLNYIERKGIDQIVRAVFVVSDDMTEQSIKEIAEYVRNSKEIDELSFRQRVDNHFQPTYHLHDFLKAGHKKDWYYIEQYDYNIYYAENEIHKEFNSFR